MKTIKVVPANSEKLAEALHSMQGRARCKYCASVEDIFDFVASADKKLEGLPKRLKIGARFGAVSGEALPKSYKYTAVRTVLVFEYRAAGWYLVDWSRDDFWPSVKVGLRRIMLSEAAYSAMMAHKMADFHPLKTTKEA